MRRYTLGGRNLTFSPPTPVSSCIIQWSVLHSSALALQMSVIRLGDGNPHPEEFELSAREMGDGRCQAGEPMKRAPAPSLLCWHRETFSGRV
jgi:hypothetical protein